MVWVECTIPLGKDKENQKNILHGSGVSQKIYLKLVNLRSTSMEKDKENQKNILNCSSVNQEICPKSSGEDKDKKKPQRSDINQKMYPKLVKFYSRTQVGEDIECIKLALSTSIQVHKLFQNGGVLSGILFEANEECECVINNIYMDEILSEDVWSSLEMLRLVKSKFDSIIQNLMSIRGSDRLDELKRVEKSHKDTRAIFINYSMVQSKLFEIFIEHSLRKFHVCSFRIAKVLTQVIYFWLQVFTVKDARMVMLVSNFLKNDTQRFLDDLYTYSLKQLQKFKFKCSSCVGLSAENRIMQLYLLRQSVYRVYIDGLILSY